VPLLPSTVAFPEPGQYVRYWNNTEHRYVYERLVERAFPLMYPRRLGSVAPGGKTALLQLREIDPSATLKHRYMAYIGVRPGALYYLNHPYDVEQLRWDVGIQEIDRDSTGWISYEESPYDAPTKYIWIRPAGFPGVTAINIESQVSTPEILIVAAKYLVLEEKDLEQEVLDRLRHDMLASLYISFGGQW